MHLGKSLDWMFKNISTPGVSNSILSNLMNDLLILNFPLSERRKPLFSHNNFTLK